MVAGTEDAAEDAPAAVAAFNAAEFGAFVYPTPAQSTALEKRTSISPEALAAYNREFVQSILNIFVGQRHAGRIRLLFDGPRDTSPGN